MLAALLAVLLSPGAAQAQQVTIRADDLIGGQCGRSWGTVLVTLSNRGRDALTGVLVGRGRREGLHEVRRPVTIPGGETVEMQLDLPPSWCDLQLCFENDYIHRCAATGATWHQNRGARDADVLVAQGTRELRPAFSVLDDSNASTPLYAGRGNPPPAPSRIAYIRADSETDIPSLPTDPAGFGHLRLFIIEVPVLDRLSIETRDALSRWVRTGGHLAVVTTGAEEVLGSPALTTLLPDLERAAGPMTVLFSPDLTALYRVSDSTLSSGEGAAVGLQLRGPRLIERDWGASRRVGMGTVHLLVTSPQAAQVVSNDATTAARAAIRWLLADALSGSAATWRQVNFDFAARGDLARSYSDNGVNEMGAARTLALDANQAHRLPLWVFVLVVLACTTGLFFVQRRWSRGGRGVAHLVGPIAAITLLGCVAVFGMSWAVRGPGDRYRSMAWIEAGSGETDGAIWRRLALAFDGPGPRRLDNIPGLRRTAPDSVTHLDDESLMVSGGRWETVIAAEHGVVDLGGPVTIEWSEGMPIAVRNGLDVSIVSARLEHASGTYALGRIAPGARIELTAPTGETFVARPSFLPESVRNWRGTTHQNQALLTGDVDWACPERGDFRGDECHTSLVIWGTP